jgi:hypothetical protein
LRISKIQKKKNIKRGWDFWLPVNPDRLKGKIEKKNLNSKSSE